MKLLYIIVLFSIIFSYLIFSQGYGHAALAKQPTSYLQSIPIQDISNLLETLEDLSRVAELTAEQIAPYIFELPDKGLEQLTPEQLVYEDSSGTLTINKVKDWNKLDRNARDEALSDITGRQISTDNEYT